VITFSQVTKTFGDDQPALEDISFHIEPSELAVVTGPSGSGKTTIVKLLTKEYLPSAGEIVFDQRPLSEVPPGLVHHHRRQIGVAFQDYRLLDDLNVWENVALALSIISKPVDEIERRVTDLLDLVKLTDKAMLFPKQLSGGEAQRVAIARALSTGPKLIIADEPTGNLDVDTSKSIATLLTKINSLGTTVLITTHDPVILDELAGYKHLELKNGQLVKGASQPPSPAAPPEDSADVQPTKSDQPAKSAKSAKSDKQHETDQADTEQTTTDQTDQPDTSNSGSGSLIGKLSKLLSKSADNLAGDTNDDAVNDPEPPTKGSSSSQHSNRAKKPTKTTKQKS